MNPTSVGRSNTAIRTERAYLRIAAELTSEIAESRYRVGDRLPTEVELADRFEVSRSTVRAALAQLEGQGMVDRRPKVGTVVRAKTPKSRYVVSVGSLAELVAFLATTVVKPVASAEVIARGALAQDLGCAPGERWLRVQTLRIPSGKAVPISWTEYYLRPRFGAVVAAMGKKPGPIYPLLEARFNVVIDRIEQDIGACLLSAPTAKMLRAKPGTAAMRVIHRLISATDGLIYCTLSVYPADRFRYFQALQRS